MDELSRRVYRQMYGFTQPAEPHEEEKPEVPALTEQGRIYKQDLIGYGCFHAWVDFDRLDRS